MSALRRSTIRLRAMIFSSRMGAFRVYRGSLGSFLPLQGTFLDLVKQPEDKNADEEHNWAENRNMLRQKLPVNESPRYQKNHFDIKKDKEHRGDIEFHRKPRVNHTLRRNAAFVGRIFDSVLLSALADQMARADDKH